MGVSEEFRAVGEREHTTLRKLTAPAEHPRPSLRDRTGHPRRFLRLLKRRDLDHPCELGTVGTIVCDCGR